MLKTLLLSGAAFAALASYATAQTQPADPATPPAASDSMTPASPGMAQDPAATQAQKSDPNLFTSIQGADVTGMGDDKLGTVADVLVDSNGQVKSLVIGHGGIVGIGRTYRNYEVSELPAVADGKLALGQLDTAALETLPEYDYPEAETGRAATGEAPADSTAPGGSAAPADSPNLATAPADAGGASAGGAGGELWPVSYIVGANVGTEDEKKKISDVRFSGNRIEAVLIDEGSLGLGNKVQEVAFENISISGTPAEPQIALSAGGGAGAPGGAGSMAPDASSAPAGQPPADAAPAPSEPAAPAAPAQ